MTTKNNNRLKVIKSVIEEINEFNSMNNSKFIPSAFGCDIHLAYENIENNYAKLNGNKSSKEWGELRYDTVYLKLMEDSVNMTKEQVIEVIDYLQAWLTLQKEGLEA